MVVLSPEIDLGGMDPSDGIHLRSSVGLGGGFFTGTILSRLIPLTIFKSGN